MVFGHRGGADGRFPENTLPAFRAGLDAGADVIELDVHLSQDGNVVVSHDDHLNRVFGVSKPVSAATARELSGLTGRDASGREHPGVGVPTLERVVEAFPGTRVNIDLKSEQPGLPERVAAVIDSAKEQSLFTVGSFIPSVLERFRAVASGIGTSAHPGEVKRLLWASLAGRRIPTSYQRVQVPVRHRGLRIISRRFVSFCHTLGLAVDAWTINEPDRARALAAMGIDGIVTDRVALLFPVLQGGS